MSQLKPNYHQWASNTLFQGLSQEEIEIINTYVYKVEYAAGEVIMREGEEGDFVLLISEGIVEVFKDELKLSEVEPGGLVGLMALIDDKPRSATVIAGKEGVQGYGIGKDGLIDIMDGEHGSIITSLMFNYIKYNQETIRSVNKLSLKWARAKLEQEKKRVMSANFFAQMVLGMVIFTFLLGFLSESAKKVDSTFVSVILLGAYALWSFLYIRLSGLPAASFGLDMTNFRRTIKPVLKATFIFVALLFVLKAVLVLIFPNKFGSQFIELYHQEGQSTTVTIIVYIVYAVHSVFQEFIARGCIQGGLMQFIGGKWGGWKSNIIAALMFSSFHIMIDMKYAFVTILPGIFWGYLFNKHKNILAISISHILIGFVAIFILKLIG